MEPLGFVDAPGDRPRKDGVPRWWHALAALLTAASWLTVFGLLAARVAFDVSISGDTAVRVLVPLHAVRALAGGLYTWKGTPLGVVLMAWELLGLLNGLFSNTNDTWEMLLVLGIPLSALVPLYWSVREGRTGPVVLGVFALSTGVAAYAIGESGSRDLGRIIILAAVALCWLVQLEFALWPLRDWRERTR